MILAQTIDLRKLGQSTEIYFDFQEIWHPRQIKNANCEYNTRQYLDRSRDF